MDMKETLIRVLMKKFGRRRPSGPTCKNSESYKMKKVLRELCKALMDPHEKGMDSFPFSERLKKALKGAAKAIPMGPFKMSLPWQKTFSDPFALSVL